MAKEMLGAKVSPRTMERLERYADQEGISKSEATQRLLDKGLDVQESDMRLVKVRGDGGTVIQDELELTQSEVDSLSQEIEEFRLAIRQMSPSLFLALFWIGLTSAFDFASTITAGTGIAVIVLLLYSYYRVVSNA
jgi:hypothetical protein